MSALTTTPALSHLRPDLDRGLDQLGLALPDPVRIALIDYLALLARWNRTYNLSAVREPAQMLVRHMFDSLAVAPHVHGNRLADIGTGPGLPGIPLALAIPKLQVLLVDSNGKKARFLRQAVRTLGLGDRCQVNQARVEALADDTGFDTITSRAWVTKKSRSGKSPSGSAPRRTRTRIWPLEAAVRISVVRA